MNDEILKLAESVGLYPYYPEQAGDIECFYKAAFNAALEQAAIAVTEIDDVDRYDFAAAIRGMKK